MQYETLKKTKITLRSDRPTAIASSRYGANIDVVGFNISFIAQRDPRLAVEVTDLLRQAAQLAEADPSGIEKDTAATIQTAAPRTSLR